MSLPCGTYNTTYAQDMAIVRTKAQWVMTILVIALLFCLPLFVSTTWMSMMNLICISIIAVLGLSILTGFTGQINLGQSAFMGVGAFTFALLNTKLGWSFWAALPCAGIMASSIGIFFGIPSLKMKGLYLALATLAAQFILAWVFMHWELLGGIAGTRADSPSIAGAAFDTEQKFYYISLGFTLLLGIAARNIIRTRGGRAFIAIRDNDLAAAGMGINVFAYKLIAFSICCFYAGIAGGLWASYVNVAHYEHFHLMDSIWYVGMLIIGGMGGIMGVVFGVTFLRLVEQAVVLIAPSIPLIGEVRAAVLGQLAYGLVIILFLIFEPRGLYHRWELFKASYRVWPYAY